MKRLLCALAVIFPAIGVAAVLPISPEAWQLQELVKNSEQQIQIAHDLLTSSQNDARAVEQAAKILDRLSAGVERSVQSFQGTQAYDRALLELQAKEDLWHSSAKDAGGQPDKAAEAASRFQRETLDANTADLKTQDLLGQALRSSEPGFVPKVQAQAQLGLWQTETRMSAQLTQLLSALQGLHDDVGGSGRSGGLSGLLSGSEMQNQKQREGMIHGPR